MTTLKAVKPPCFPASLLGLWEEKKLGGGVTEVAGGDCDAGEDPQVSGDRGIRALSAAHHEWGLGQLGLASSVT